MEKIPEHLKKYIVEQNEAKYTPIDHAAWRYILRQLRSFLSIHAHDFYLEGLEKTGVEVESIPSIAAISKKIEKFGWRALPVSGFIPPAAFMEMQALGILPIASDMRTLDHLLYTPAPDIVHEAAGHAPMLAHPEYASYLKEYAQIAKKAILSKEDLDLYEAIRNLSDIKENPAATPEQIKDTEAHLAKVSADMGTTSEASELSRMNWWTAEYGLIGDEKNPKIFGAGLLSSVGESRWCLSEKVKKIPLSAQCVQVSYDITEPQPQLFVAKDFHHLKQALYDFANTMAYKIGGTVGLNKILKAQTINTVEFNSGIQISGKLIEVLNDKQGYPIYLRFDGPSQLCYQDTELSGHGKQYHAHGYGTALGKLKSFPNTCPSELPESFWAHGQNLTLEFESGIIVSGKLKSHLMKNGRCLIASFDQATVTFNGRKLFEPAWGIYDLALGTSIPSVFGGPADRAAFGELTDFVAARVPEVTIDPKTKKLQEFYSEIRKLRSITISASSLEEKLGNILSAYGPQFPQDWLLRLEMYELVLNYIPQSKLKHELYNQLQIQVKANPKMRETITDGLALAGIL